MGSKSGDFFKRARKHHETEYLKEAAEKYGLRWAEIEQIIEEDGMDFYDAYRTIRLLPEWFRQEIEKRKKRSK